MANVGSLQQIQGINNAAQLQQPNIIVNGQEMTQQPQTTVGGSQALNEHSNFQNIHRVQQNGQTISMIGQNQQSQQFNPNQMSQNLTAKLNSKTAQQVMLSGQGQQHSLTGMIQQQQQNNVLNALANAQNSVQSQGNQQVTNGQNQLQSHLL